MGTTNQLYGGASVCTTPPSTAQTVALEQFCSMYKAMGHAPDGLTPAGAFSELCHSGLPYSSEGGGPASYDRELLSLPALGGSPVDTCELLSEEHRDLVLGRKAPMLRSPDEAKCLIADAGLLKPHSDPALQSGRVYGEFIQSLLERGLVELQTGGKSYLGVSFVKKKNGKIRLIFDTRIVNCLFVDPPKTKLPSAAALTSIESVPGEPLYFAGGDIDNAFYRFEAPVIAREFFYIASHSSSAPWESSH